MSKKKQNGWATFIEEQFHEEYWVELERFLSEEESRKNIYPKGQDLFRAFDLCPLDETRVVILGQDPYYKPGRADGLAFSVKRGNKIPPTLRNIFKEINRDLDVPIPKHGDLSKWAEQGVLLLNSALTVPEGEPKAHLKVWEPFIIKVIQECIKRECIFMIWGMDAYDLFWKAWPDELPSAFVSGGHPSPQNNSARKFLGCGHFSTVNQWLEEKGEKEINWDLT